MALKSDKTGVILLGSESFPQSQNFKESAAFAEAKGRIHAYFTQTLKVPTSQVLDLFDSADLADQQDKRVEEFIMAQTQNGILDLFIYYVGHGGYANGDTFYLAIKNTRDNNPLLSSITLQSLANTVRQSANGLRTFLILDCCFSGAAGNAFMSDSGYVSAVHFKEVFPEKGVALLCASAAGLPALIVQERNITMFTEGLEEALKNGDQSLKEKYLTLRQIKDLAYANIIRKNPDNPVRPEVITATQLDGDIAEIPHFPNSGFRLQANEPKEKIKQIMREMTSNNFSNVASLFLDFVDGFDRPELLLDSIMIGSECNELEEDKNSMEKGDYLSRKQEVYKRIVELIQKITQNDPQAENR